MNRTVLVLIAIAAALALPYAAGPFWMGLATQMLIFGLLALSTDLLLGHAGLFSLCHASFFAVSAYTVAILQVRYGVPTALAAPAGLFAGTLLAAIFGLAVRTRGVYFILVTLALGYVVWGVLHRWSSFTGGDNGVTNVPFPAVGPLAIGSHTQYYYFVLAVIALCVLGYRVLVRSPFGLTLRGIKASESRMRSLGYRTGAHLYAAFVLSGVVASLAGVLYVYYNRFVNPVSASFPISVEAVLMAIVGGSGTVIGPFLGASVILGLRNWVSSFSSSTPRCSGSSSSPPCSGHRRGSWESPASCARAPAARGPHLHERARDPGRRPREGLRRPARGRRRELRRRGGRAPRADRPERRRQDDALPLHHRRAVAERGRGRALRARITRLAEPARTALGMSRTFQISNVLADLAVIENMILALLGTDRRKWVLHRPVAAFGAVRARAMEGLARVGLERRAELPARLLSYGERRQLELALALNSNPRVLLLDEPCAGLSPSERQRISQTIAALPREITLLMIEHDMDVALALADRVTVLHRGKVILEGTSAEVQANPEVREVYFGHV